MTLQEYFQLEHDAGKIDFALRAHCWEGEVQIYIHPAGKDGITTPTLVVTGNTVTPKFPQFEQS